MRNKYLKLFLARDNITLEDFFTKEPNECGWEGDIGTSNWHKVTLDSNIDKSSGLDGVTITDAAGCYEEGSMEKSITVDSYSEVTFEYYVQNNSEGDRKPNSLNFYIDDDLKLTANGPTPWLKTEPIGIRPGEHIIKFEYIVNGAPMHKKTVLDTIKIYESKEIDCLITKYEPPKPSGSLSKHEILRGHSRLQQLRNKDCEIKFTAEFSKTDFKDFIIKSDGIFYFVDELGTAYRGIFADTIDPKSIALAEYYSIDLVLFCPQKAGIGFV